VNIFFSFSLKATRGVKIIIIKKEQNNQNTCFLIYKKAYQNTPYFSMPFANSWHCVAEVEC